MRTMQQLQTIDYLSSTLSETFGIAAPPLFLLAPLKMGETPQKNAAISLTHRHGSLHKKAWIPG